MARKFNLPILDYNVELVLILIKLKISLSTKVAEINKNSILT